MTDLQRELPGPRAQPTAAAGLEPVRSAWHGNGRLPGAVIDSVLDRTARLLASGGTRPLDAFHWPGGWPPPSEAVAALGAFADLEADLLAELLRQGALDLQALTAVHNELSFAREQVLVRSVGSPQTLHQALEARDRQLSIATHELRTPISSILLNLQMLEKASRERGPLDAGTVSRLLAVPQRQLRRLARMVGLLLDAAQVEAERLVLQPEPLDLCNLVHDAVRRLQAVAAEHQCELVALPSGSVHGRWDRLRLEQVVTNLLTNAIKYGGDRVEIGCLGTPAPAILVRDHGPGIAPEDQARIFEPFERLPSGPSEQGAGLGLYIVREIVRAHGGRIEVDSAPGRGSTFTVHLPA